MRSRICSARELSRPASRRAETITLTASAEGAMPTPAAAALPPRAAAAARLSRRCRARRPSGSASSPRRRSIRGDTRRAGERAAGTTVIAGYPWFGDWGRDTMIALPGLTSCNAALRRGSSHSAHLCRLCERRHAAESFSRPRRGLRIQHGRCDLVVLPCRKLLCRGERGSAAAARPFSVAARHLSSGISAARASASKSTPRMACCARASPAAQLSGWTPKSAIG